VKLTRSTFALSVLAVLAVVAVGVSTGRSEPAESQGVSPATSAAALPTTSPAAISAPTVGGPAAVIRLSGRIDNYNRDQLRRHFERARAAGAKTIILEIDTDGGMVLSGLDISRFLKNQTDLHIIAFVNARALSAGAMIALACNEIVMTPSASLGDCAPIQVGVTNLGPTERSKAESPVLTDFKESAKRNGYDPLLASAMVSMPISVHWIQDEQGNRRFVNDADFKSLVESGKWKVVPGVEDPIDSDNTLLTVDTARAKQLGLSRGEARSADDLAAQRGLTVVSRYESGAGDFMVALLGSDLIRLVLLIVFLNALFLALKTPGHGYPSVRM